MNIDVFSRGRLYKVAARVLGKEKVETEAGTFDAWKIQPVMREKESEDDRNKGKLSASSGSPTTPGASR